MIWQLQQHVRRKDIRILVVPKLSTDSNSLGRLDDKTPGLKILLLNARSVKGKTTIQDLILNEHAVLAYITETWLDESGGGNFTQLCPPEFSVQQQARGR